MLCQLKLTYFGGSEDVIILEDRAEDVVFWGEVLCAVHGVDTRQSQGCRGINLQNLGEGSGAVHRTQVQLAFPVRHIVTVNGLT